MITEDSPLTAVFMSQVGTVTANNRVYSRDVVATALAALRDETLGYVVGQVDIPEHQPAFTVHRMRLHGEQLLGDVRLLSTDAGRRLWDLMNLAQAGAPFTISFHTCGSGMLTQNSDGVYVVSEYTLESIGAMVNSSGQVRESGKAVKP